jgi:hypothetical protein
MRNTEQNNQSSPNVLIFGDFNFPNIEWKHGSGCAYITHLFKSGIKSLPVNYRPVSLTSHIAKTMERVIRKPLVNFLEVNGKMNPSQHGFRSKRSCLSQLLEHHDNVLNF